MTWASIDSRPARSSRPSSRSTSTRASRGSSSLFSFSRSSAISRFWSSSPSSFWIAFICSRRNISRCRSPSSSCTCDLISACAASMPICFWTWIKTRRSRSSTPSVSSRACFSADRQLDVAGDQVGEPAGLGHRVEHLVEHLLGQPLALAQLHGPLAGLPVEGGEGRVVLVDRLHLLDRHDVDGEEPFGVVVMQGRGADLALEQELDASQPALDLADPADHPHRVELLRSRLVDVLALGHGEDQAVPLERLFNRPQRPRPAHADRHREPGKDHRPAQRQYGRVSDVPPSVRSFSAPHTNVSMDSES